MSLENVALSKEIQDKLKAQKEFVEKLRTGRTYLVSEVETHLRFLGGISGSLQINFRYSDELRNFYIFSKLEGEGLLRYSGLSKSKV